MTIDQPQIDAVQPLATVGNCVYIPGVFSFAGRISAVRRADDGTLKYVILDTSAWVPDHADLKHQNSPILAQGYVPDQIPDTIAGSVLVTHSQMTGDMVALPAKALLKTLLPPNPKRQFTRLAQLKGKQVMFVYREPTFSFSSSKPTLVEILPKGCGVILSVKDSVNSFGVVSRVFKGGSSIEVAHHVLVKDVPLGSELVADILASKGVAIRPYAPANSKIRVSLKNLCWISPIEDIA